MPAGGMKQPEGTMLVYIAPFGALQQLPGGAEDSHDGSTIGSLREQLATSGTGVSYNFETGIVTGKHGVKYKNGERVE